MNISLVSDEINQNFQWRMEIEVVDIYFHMTNSNEIFFLNKMRNETNKMHDL